MKCALDLQLRAEVRAKENAEVEAARKNAEEVARRASTIALCERLGKMLEQKAENGKKPEISFICDLGRYRFTEWCSLTNCHRLERTYDDYADKRESYVMKENINLKLMAEWFGRYCFKLDCCEHQVWIYGLGKCKCSLITISPNPQC